MVVVIYDDKFTSFVDKIKDTLLRTKIYKLIEKIIKNPTIGKPMRYGRKGTRELYIKPFRLSYCFHPNTDTIEILELYHKKKQ